MDLARRASIHAALGDAHRLAIVDQLVESDRSPRELADLLAIRPSLLAFHLDQLERGGLIRRSASDADRRRKYVQLVRTDLAALVPAARAPSGEVVFVCTRNSARSQLAAALWRRHRGATATSAGTDPADGVHPGAIAAADRVGLDLRGRRPRRLSAADADRSIITVCDRAYEDLGRTTRHWSVPDPVAADVPDAFDRALATIRDRIIAIDRTDDTTETS